MRGKIFLLASLSVFCFLLKMKFGLFIFGTLLLYHLFNYYRDPERKLWVEIHSRASSFDVNIPRHEDIRREIFSAHKKLKALEFKSPLMAGTCENIADEFWRGARSFINITDWEESLNYLERHIPQVKTSKLGLEAALSEAQTLNLRVDEADSEARKSTSFVI